MPNFLKNHPFAVEAHFDSSLVLTFAVPKSQIECLIPESLSLDTFQDQWAFIAIAMVQTSSLRPKGFPKFMGNDFFLIGYRVFVRYVNKAGKNLRGLYILKSETDSKKMHFLGNIFTHYNYGKTDIQITNHENLQLIKSEKSNFNVTIDKGIPLPELPSNSPFNSWKEARRFAGPLPFTFTHNSLDQSVLIIEGVRNNWTPKPIQINEYHFEFLNQLKLVGIVLANAFEVTDIPYHWKKGTLESWK